MTEAGRGKLVRDKIPAIIAASGEQPITYEAHPVEYTTRLRDKLGEEVDEYLASGDPGELADILEVVRALAALAGIYPGGLEKLRAAKAEERGGFGGRIVWMGNA